MRWVDMIPQTEIRCCDCSRLLFKMEPDALNGALSIRCHRCKAMNIFRPTRAPNDERAKRPIIKGPDNEDPREDRREDIRDHPPSSAS